VRIHLDKIKPGNGVQTITIDSQKIGLPPDVSIVSIHPPKATIRIEPLIEKVLPIIVSLTGKPTVGFYVAEMIVNPDTVRVKGPKSIMLTQTQIQIKPIDVHGVSESFEQRIALDLPDGLKPVQPDQFTVKITVKEKIVSKQLADVSIQGHGTQRSFRISPPTLTMKIKGPLRTVQHIKENPDFSVYVDLSGLDPGVYVRRAVIILPMDVSLIQTDPELFTIRIEKK
jgi:YbbR domain-containing protein